MEAATDWSTALVRVSIHDSGAVFFHLQSGLLFASNGTGARIWRGLARKQDPASIANELCRDYGIPHERACADTAQFIGELSRCHLSHSVGGSR